MSECGARGVVYVAVRPHAGVRSVGRCEQMDGSSLFALLLDLLQLRHVSVMEGFFHSSGPWTMLCSVALASVLSVRLSPLVREIITKKRVA